MYHYPYVSSAYPQQAQFQPRSQFPAHSQFQKTPTQPGLPPQTDTPVLMTEVVVPVLSQGQATAVVDSVEVSKAGGKPKKVNGVGSVLLLLMRPRTVRSSIIAIFVTSILTRRFGALC